MKKLTKAQAGLACLVAHGFSVRAISRQEAENAGLLPAFEAALKGKLIQSAGYEASGKGEDWLRTAEGRAAIAQATIRS